MKKTLIASVALASLIAGGASAADLPARAPPMAPVYAAPIFSWTGFYIGANVGGAWDRTSVTDTLGLLNVSTGSNNGVFMAGGTVGANYQLGSFVLGAEADFDWIANNNNNAAAAVGVLSVTGNDRWISTAAARFGFAADRVLFYGKAGGGWVGNNGFTVTNAAGGSFTGSNNNTNAGWLVGAGIEWAFAYNWSVKLEYDYLGLSSQTFTTPAGFLPVDTFTTGNNNIQMVKLGVNYRFGWDAPVSARY